MAVEVLHVRPPDVPGSPQPGTGSEADPLQSVQQALDKAKELRGARIKLEPGHYVEHTSLEDFKFDHGAIVVEPRDPAAGRVYIDACLPDFLFPDTDQWIRVGPGADGIDEYVSSRRYEPVGEGVGGSERGRVRSGALLDEPRHTRLVGYDQHQDLVAANQLWPDKTARPGVPPWPDDVKGNRVWRLHPDQQRFKDRWVPEKRNDKPWYHPFVYMGPGVWFDTETSDDSSAHDPSHRRVHIRLSPTANGIDGWPDFDPSSTDPNKARLALAREETRAVFMKNCHNVTFRNLTLRFGSPETVRLNSCTNVVFDRCRIRSASRAFFLLEEVGPIDKITIADCEVDGGLPTWFFRSDRKDEYVYGDDMTDAEIAALVTTGGLPLSALTPNGLGSSTSGVLISGEGAIGQVTVRNCEIFNGHDCYLFGSGMRFHHNWVHNLNDDGLAASALGQANEVEVHSNVMTRCLTGLSFGGGKVGTVHVFANLFDLRLPTLGRRPKTPGDDDVRRQGLFFKNGADERVINLFHNTCLVLDPGAKGDTDLNDVGFAYYSGVGASLPRNAYNNIFVAAYTTATVNPIAVLAPGTFDCEAGGNLFFRIPEGETHNFTVRRRKVDSENGSFMQLVDYWNKFWPNQSHDVPQVHEWGSLRKNPWFRSFDSATGRWRQSDDFRLFKLLFLKSPAKDSAVTMQTAALTDKYQSAIGAQPTDRGCYPPNGDPMRVGVEGRVTFPRPPPSDPEPVDTHADDDWPPLAHTP